MPIAAALLSFDAACQRRWRRRRKTATRWKAREGWGWPGGKWVCARRESASGFEPEQLTAPSARVWARDETQISQDCAAWWVSGQVLGF